MICCWTKKIEKGVNSLEKISPIGVARSLLIGKMKGGERCGACSAVRAAAGH